MARRYEILLAVAVGAAGGISASAAVIWTSRVHDAAWVSLMGSIFGGFVGGVTTLVAAWIAWRGIKAQMLEQKRAMAFPFRVREYEAICERLPGTQNIMLFSNVILNLFGDETKTHNEIRQTIFSFFAKKKLSESEIRSFQIRKFIEDRCRNTNVLLQNQFISALEFVQQTAEIPVEYARSIHADDVIKEQIESRISNNTEQCQFAMKRLRSACTHIAESADRDERRSRALKNEIDAVLGDPAID
jgi:hypothetical protein